MEMQKKLDDNEWITVKSKKSYVPQAEFNYGKQQKQSFNKNHIQTTIHKPGTVTYNNGDTIIHGSPNVKQMMRDGNYSITKNTKNTSGNVQKQTIINMSKIEDNINGPTLTYVSFPLAIRIANGRNEYIDPNTSVKGITQQELATLIGGITAGDVRAVENTSGKTVFDPVLISKICNKLNISASNS